MGKKAQMSIGQPINEIPGVKRKREQKTRVTTVLAAFKKMDAGKVLPIYTGSKFAAANLAMVIRKDAHFKGATVAVRKHIVYVQADAEAGMQKQDILTTPLPELSASV